MINCFWFLDDDDEDDAVATGNQAPGGNQAAAGADDDGKITLNLLIAKFLLNIFTWQMKKKMTTTLNHSLTAFWVMTTVNWNKCMSRDTKLIYNILT